ncbi:hypothetical protein [Helicobacter cynogastricus]|uniref:hypothetical protein n=1 Tax=Helicobacter cynogastricus TaxID=329937 RepID=UPI000CF016E0|nr:hypothetical protein [Helicobacter cynogastricus]
MPPVFKLDRSYMEFSAILEDGTQQNFRFYDLSDFQSKRLFELSSTQGLQSASARMQLEYETIESNLLCLNEDAQKAQEYKQEFLNTMQENGKTMDFVSFVQEELAALRAQKKPNLKRS